MSENNTIIKLENITKTYDMGETKLEALKGITYTIKRGEMMAIMGPSGSGKSTLMNIIGCLDKPTKGTYYLEDEKVSTMDKNRLAGIRNRRIGFVFQNFNLLARTSSLENVELPLIYSNVPAKEAREKARLDTKTGMDIMEVFKSLHEESGITIILVTHDPEVSDYAENIIHIRDGLIEKEDRR